MKILKYCILIFAISLGSISAQSFVNSVNATDQTTLKVLCLMVEFQEDNYDATTGNGKFGSIYTQAYGDTILDPLPHDANYFSDHMEFAKNYFFNVSRGRLLLDYFVVPDIITVPKYMRDYSLPYESNDYAPLAALAEDSWTILDDSHPGINIADYELFMIFHAGVSNSLDDGQLTLNRNLPSLYLSEKTLKDIYGADFTGFQVENGNYGITNTIILPETESREYDLITGETILQELTINGVIVTNIASHLGLPDLFDTETGRSKIGRFGLMDSQASIANWGLFPPAPSAWEKIKLGWAEAVEVTESNNNLSVVADLVANDGDTTIIKIPINSSEYFLVENRIKDALNNNIVLKYKLNGQLHEKVVLPNEDGSYSIVNDEIDGVLVDVDEYEASLPGDGIVIWHIDESVIAEKTPTNDINNDKKRMGVDVEEADGVNDLGETFTSIFGDFLVGEGTEQDFWYASNEAELYQNKFSYNTLPSSKSNYESNSLITIEDFSDIANKMTFKLSLGTEEVSAVAKIKLKTESSPEYIIPTYQNDVLNYYIILENDDLLYLNTLGEVILTVSDFSHFKPVLAEADNKQYLIGSYENSINIFEYDNGNLTSSNKVMNNNVTAPLSLYESGSDKILLVGFETGDVVSIYLSNIIAGIAPNFNFTGNSNPVLSIAGTSSYHSWITQNSFKNSNGTELSLGQSLQQLVLTKSKNGSNLSVVLGENNTFYIISGDELLEQFTIESDSEIESFSLADINGDGENHIVFNDGSSLRSINLLGYTTDGFPISDYCNQEYQFSSMVLNNSAETDYLMVFTRDGRVNLIDDQGRSLNESFPLSVGDKFHLQPSITSVDEGRVLLTVLNTQNELFNWEISTTLQPKYSALYVDNYNSSFIPKAADAAATPDGEIIQTAYNYPNPVYDNETYIRYSVTENSGITIKIFDLSGDLVEEISTNAVGGFENETPLNVSDYSSGVYFCVLEILGESGSSRNELIKIAVIK